MKFGFGENGSWNVAKLLVALFAGVFSFFVSLAGKAPEEKVPMTAFVQVIKDVPAGMPFRSDFFQMLEVPDVGRGSLYGAAVLWEDRVVLYDRPAARDLLRGDMVLIRDVVDPRRRFDLQADEVAIHVRMASATLEPSLLNVGDLVGFVTVDENESEFSDLFTDPDEPRAKPEDRSSVDAGTVLGPFRLVTVGKSLSPDSAPSVNGAGIVTVAGRLDEQNRLNSDARMLLSMTNGNSRLSVVLYPNFDKTKSRLLQTSGR